MRIILAFAAGLVSAAGLASAAALAAPPARTVTPLRTVPPGAAIATSVALPPGARLIYVSGQVPGIADTAAPEGSVARFGDTHAQARSVFAKLEAALVARGMGLGDIVMLRVFLVAPPGAARMDFAGMSRAYAERFGTAAQPNRPARSTMQVAGLVDPGWLVEIEATAAK